MKILTVFGTRPEAIKMCPLVNELKERNELTTIVCVTGQHREMLDSVLSVFNVCPDYDLNIMKNEQTLSSITSSIVTEFQKVLDFEKPDLVLVHGDTSTTFASALTSFYNGVKVGHVEAGLRTNNIYSPFPEEFNRRSVTLVSNFNFAPTEAAKKNLINEHVDEKTIFITGNTAIDALSTTVVAGYSHPILDEFEGKKLILITAHRRENLGIPMENMFRAIKRIIDENDDLYAVYPIHMNPKVRKTASNILGDHSRIKIIDPLDVTDFHNFLNESYLILTDSGGIQEEAPSLGKPVLVMRDTTERPEGVEAGTLKLVGTNEESIYSTFNTLITDEDAYHSMANASNPFGDGTASKQIVDIIIRELGK